MAKIFIDGSAGTTGLRIAKRLSSRSDIELILLPDELRKNTAARKVAINSADIVFLCLPDAASIEAVTLADSKNTVIIDTSTAHRTAKGWVYGFPELINKETIKSSKRIANPGCHASGFIALIKPLIDRGILDKSAKLSCFSLTGYSGGGKGMIADYEAAVRDQLLNAPRQYALTQQHKHLKEMTTVCGLKIAPAFCPIVCDFYSGMEVSITLFADDINGSLETIKQAYKEQYTGNIIKYVEDADKGGFLSAAKFSGYDSMQISVHGNDERILLVCRFDNLGKGASGAAIQNMNLVLGVDEDTGLDIYEEM